MGKEEIEPEKNILKILLSSAFILFAVTLLILYWFVPFRSTEFNISGSTDFLINNSQNQMQFYPKMRFPNKQISYTIEKCPLQKQNNMLDAFEIIENKTLLEFFSVQKDPNIFVTCDSNSKIEEGLFIAGEGGPTKVISTENFNTILNGKILLIRNSNCPTPNIAIHELLHVLGFEHSTNPNNIMYNFSYCYQEIGDDTINLINELYSTPSLPDLSLGNISVSINGRYLDCNISIINSGLQTSETSELKIYANNEIIKKEILEPIEIGHGIKLSLQNLWTIRNIKKIKFELNSTKELSHENNIVTFDLKK